MKHILNKKMDKRTVLMAKIATMYYKDNISQKNIAEILSISRPTVCRVLEQARQTKMVEININIPTIRCKDMENRLKQKYDFKNVIVTIQPSVNNKNTTDSLGKACAEFIVTNLKNDLIFGMDMGGTILNMANQLSEMSEQIEDKMRNITLIPLMGGNGDDKSYANDICNIVAKTLCAKTIPLYSPLIVSTFEEKERFIQSKMVKNCLDIATKADKVFLNLSDIQLIGSDLLSILGEKELHNLHLEEAVGYIGAKFFDKHGKTSTISVNRRIIGVDIKSPYNSFEKILVAGGDDKKELIRIAAKGKLFDSIITDENVAQYLLDKEN